VEPLIREKREKRREKREKRREKREKRRDKREKRETSKWIATIFSLHTSSKQPTECQILRSWNNSITNKLLDIHPRMMS
jgi:hypothetical protein